MGGAKALREEPGRATNVAKTRSERSGKRRDGAKRKVSEGSGLRLALVAAACRSSLRWRWWQWAIAVMHYCDAILGTHGSCSKSFWDSPLVEGPGRQVHPKTTTFCLVLGFTPSTQPSRAHQSQNDLEQGYPADSATFFGRAHRGKSTKHTTQIARLAIPAAEMAKSHTRNCHFQKNSKNHRL